MKKQEQPQTDFLIEPFILDLARHFWNCPENETFYVMLSRERVYTIDGEGQMIFRRILADTFQALQKIDIKKAFHQMKPLGRKNTFLVGNLHFASTIDSTEFTIQFRKNRPFEFHNQFVVKTHILRLEPEESEEETPEDEGFTEALFL